jgi:hypothetical protein
VTKEKSFIILTPDVFPVGLAHQRDHLPLEVLDGLGVHAVRALLAPAIVQPENGCWVQL